MVSVGLGLALAGTTGRASANGEASEAFALTWDAPPECPPQSRVKSEVARLLGGSIPAPQGGVVEARAAVAKEKEWSVQLTTRTGDQIGRRAIQAASCQDLADATALIVALMIDPAAVEAHAGAAKVERRPEPPSPTVLVPPPVASPAGHPIDVLAGIHGQASLGILPGVDVGIGAGFGMSGRRWRVEARGTYGLRRNQARASADPEAYGQFNFLGGALSTCINLGDDAFAFGPCADAELGMTWAQGHGVSVGFPARTTWFALGGGAYAAIAMGRHLAIPLHLDVLAPLLRPRYVINDIKGTVYQAPAVGGRLTAGIAWRF
jgi:hypothetical protein